MTRGLQCGLLNSKVDTLVVLSGPLNLRADEFYIRHIKKLFDSGIQPHLQSQIKGTLDKFLDRHAAAKICAFAANTYNDGENAVAAMQYACSNLSIQDPQMAVEYNTRLRKLQTCAQLEKIGEMAHSLGRRYSHNPGELICQLYFTFAPRAALNLPCIRGVSWKTLRVADSLCRFDSPCDLHGLVGRIAERHGIDANKMRRRLLTKWITDSPEASLTLKRASLDSLFEASEDEIEHSAECVNDLRFSTCLWGATTKLTHEKMLFTS